MKINDGGLAFPVATSFMGGVYGHSTDDGIWQFSGMTLRDYFAAKALQGWMASDDSTSALEHGSFEESQAKTCRLFYGWADAMLAARTHQEPTK